MKYISTLSYGKDSTVMNDLLLKHNYPVDYILFHDTFAEFQMMYDYKTKVELYFKERYGKEVITTQPKTTFEEWCFGVIRDSNAVLNGWIRGIPMVWSQPCYWRRESKMKPCEDFIKKEIGEEPHKIYVGFTLDETHRMSKDENILYPLIHDFKMSERNCQEYLINQEMENPLYRYFTRTGCGICPAQSDKAWYEVWKNFKDMWAYMQWIEERLCWYEARGMKVQNKYWFSNFRSCAQMEEKFKAMEKQGSLFDLSDEPQKDCFCKI